MRISRPSSPNAPNTHPPSSSSSLLLTSRLSRRQPVKNDRGVSLLGQWQIEYILASSEKRVLRFVYRLSCYAKDRNFCRLRIRRIATFILRARQLLRHCIIARLYTVITVNNSKEMEREREEAGGRIRNKNCAHLFRVARAISEITSLISSECKNKLPNRSATTSGIRDTTHKRIYHSTGLYAKWFINVRPKSSAANVANIRIANIYTETIIFRTIIPARCSARYTSRCSENWGEPHNTHIVA